GWNPLALQICDGLFLIHFQLMILTAVALLSSSFSTHALPALLTFFVFIAGHFSADLTSLATNGTSAAARLLFRALYYLLPNLANFSLITPAAHGVTPTANAFALATVYMFFYVGVLLAAATLIFSRRNFK